MNLAFALFMALSSGASLQVAQPQEPPKIHSPAVFGVQVDSVYVDAFVSQRRDPVVGLTAADFELKDNGVVQRIDLVSAEALPLTAVLVFDSSNSLAGERLSALQASGKAFLESLRPQDEVSLFTFAGETQWLVRPTSDKAAVARALDGLQPGGATAVLDALYAALVLPQTPGTDPRGALHRRRGQHELARLAADACGGRALERSHPCGRAEAGRGRGRAPCPRSTFPAACCP